MTIDRTSAFLSDSDERQIAAAIRSALNVPSALIGATGPPSHPGPEEGYLAAIRSLKKTSPDLMNIFTSAVESLLISLAAEIGASGKVEGRFLLFNLCSLLEAVRLPRVHIGLRALCECEKPIREALADRNEDLYVRLLIAYAVNQERPANPRFWLDLLSRDDLKMIGAGIVGLRESGWENACCYLAEVQEKYRQHPALGDFSEEIELMIDTYADLNWPDCARDHLDTSVHPDIWKLLQEHSGERYRPAISELEGPAIDIIKDQASVVESSRQRWESRGTSPIRALVGDGAGGVSPSAADRT
jgi:hypothetical protein